MDDPWVEGLQLSLLPGAEAEVQGLELSRSRLAELQPLAGRNPMLARKVVRQERLGIRHQRPEHTQYIVVMPIIIAALMAFGIVRFIGMGTQNKSLYIFGGTALKQLGSVRGRGKGWGGDCQIPNGAASQNPVVMESGKASTV